MKSIIPEQSQSTIFDKLIQAAMDIFISEGEVLGNSVYMQFMMQWNANFSHLPVTRTNSRFPWICFTVILLITQFFEPLFISLGGLRNHQDFTVFDF